MNNSGEWSDRTHRTLHTVHCADRTDVAIESSVDTADVIHVVDRDVDVTTFQYGGSSDVWVCTLAVKCSVRRRQTQLREKTLKRLCTTNGLRFSANVQWLT